MTTTATVMRSKLTVYDENAPGQPLVATTDGAEIARLLAEVGVRFERWTAEAEFRTDAEPADVLAAYATSVKRVQQNGGYATVDVLRLAKGTPNTAPMREKFLSEHLHSEDEVRFFVEGSGAFYLHLRGKVYQAICVRGDLISVPAGTLHWFDMGPDPAFTALRWFNNPEGWVAQYSSSDIAARFPKYE
jgi:1,2-dihydroxy-3-keto-5-methylthiopentene dioxygenase